MHMDIVNKHLSKFILLTTYLVTITAIPIVHAALISFPTDTEVVVGQMVRLNCSTSDRYYVLWEHTAVGATNYEYVFFSGRIITPYHVRHRIEGNSSAGEYHLVITNVQSSDAGLYVCVDQAGHGERREAQLIVLDSRPTCNCSDEIRGENPCNIPEEQLKVKCSLGYSGKRPPMMECGIKDDFTAVLATAYETDATYRKAATYDFILEIAPMQIKDSALVCQTTSSKITSNEFSTKVIYISENYATDDSILHGPDVLSCSVKSSESCQYKWFYERNNRTTVSNGDVVWANQSGTYRCEANCSLRDTYCTFIPRTVISIQTIEVDEVQNGTPIFAIILIVVCLSLLVVLVLILTLCVRKKIIKKQANTRNDQTELHRCIENLCCVTINRDATNRNLMIYGTEAKRFAEHIIDSDYQLEKGEEPEEKHNEETVLLPMMTSSRGHKRSKSFPLYDTNFQKSDRLLSILALSL